jgi:hypothetical protein
VTDAQRHEAPDVSATPLSEMGPHPVSEGAVQGVRPAEPISLPRTATFPAPAVSRGPVALPWKSDRLPLIIGACGHRDLREGDVAKLKAAVASVITALRRQYLGNDKQTPIVVLSALAEGADQLIAGEALKQGATLILALPLPLSEYRRDFVQRPLTPDAIKDFEDMRHKAAATVEMPLAPGNTENGVKSFGAERDRQYREANMFIARHCHVLIALYDGNDDDVTVGGAAEAVKFSREGIAGVLRGPGRPVLEGSEIGPVIHVVTPRKTVKTTAGEVTIAPWGTKVKSPPKGEPKSPLESNAGEARAARAWAQFRAVADLTMRFNREAKAREKKRAPEIEKNIHRLFGDNPEAQARAHTAATRWCRFFGLTDTIAQEREKRVRGSWRDIFLLSLAALVLFAVYSHLFPKNLLLLVYAVVAAVVVVFYVYDRLSRHTERALDYRALAEALRVGLFWKLVAIGGESPGTPLAAPLPRSVSEAYPMVQPNALAFVKSSLRALDLTDRLDPPTRTSQVALDSYGWTREFWVGAQHDACRALAARYSRISERRQRSAIALFIASVALAAIFSTIDIYDELAGHPSTIMSWAEGTAGFIVSHASFLPAVVIDFVNAVAGLTYPVLVFVIALLPGVAALILGYSTQMGFKAQSKQCAQLAFLFERALEMLPETHHAGRKSIMSGILEPELAAHCQAVLAELGTAAMRESADWVALHRDHLEG